MKFLFLSSYAHLVLDPESTRVSGGAELQVALLARELARRGYDAVLAGGDIGQLDDVVFQGVRTRNAGHFHTGGLADAISALPRVAKILHEEQPDYVLVLGWTAWLFILHVLKPFFGYKLVFICGLDTEVNGEFKKQNFLRGGLFDFAMRRCDVRFAMTKLQEQLFQECGLSCGLYRNLILPRSAPYGRAKDVDFLWVSRCQKIKRPQLFLDLVEKLPNARCAMICPREDVALWEAVKKRADTLPNLQFHERVPYHLIQGHYDVARVFVNTSEWEGWPNSFIQSGLGHAALLSLLVRPDQIFKDYDLGFCADGNFESFLDWARGIVDDHARSERMGDECARFVSEMHDNAMETDAFLQGLFPDNFPSK